MSRGIIIGIAAGVAVVVVVAVGWWFLSRPQSPDDVAKSYLLALAEGDGDAALALTDATVPARDDVIAAFKAATAYVEEPDVGAVGTTASGSAGSTSVGVSFTLAGEPITGTLSLIETADGWRVQASTMGALTATTTLGDSIRVGDVLLAAGEPHPLLPAAYAVSASPARFLEGSASAVVVPVEVTEIALDASLGPAATEAAQSQLESYAQECTQPAAEVVPACGIRIPWQADLASLATVAYRIEAAPIVTLAEDGTTFVATGGILVATVDGLTRAGTAGRFTYRTDAWSLYGSVAFTQDEMTLAVR